MRIVEKTEKNWVYQPCKPAGMPAIQQPTPNTQVCFSNFNGIIDAVISVKQFPELSHFIKVLT